MADKEWELMLGVLAKVVDEVIFTRVKIERSADPQHLADKLKAAIPQRVFDDSRLGLQTLLDESQADDLIVVAGSLYLLGEVRPMLQRLAAAQAANGQSAN